MFFDKACKDGGQMAAYFRNGLIREDGGRSISNEAASWARLRWFGEACRRLDLDGQVREEQFLRLLRGRHPSTAKFLGQRDRGAQRRRSAINGVGGVPKAYSILALVAGDLRLLEAFDRNETATLREAEEVGAYVRGRAESGRHTQTSTRSLIGVRVTHITSRDLDPLVHGHATLLNLTWAKGRFMALDPFYLYKTQAYLREVSFNAQARTLREFGYEIESSSYGYRIVGVDSDVEKLFSKRREAIVRQLEASGQSDSAASKKLAAVHTRKRKEGPELTLEQLQERWREQLTKRQLESLLKVKQDAERRCRGTTIAVPTYGIAVGLEHVAKKCFSNRHSLDRTTILTEALRAGRSEIDSLPLLKAAVSQYPVFVWSRVREYATSYQRLNAESKWLGHYVEGRGLCTGQYPQKQMPVKVRDLLARRDRIVAGWNFSEDELHALEDANQSGLIIREAEKLGVLDAADLAERYENRQIFLISTKPSPMGDAVRLLANYAGLPGVPTKSERAKEKLLNQRRSEALLGLLSASLTSVRRSVALLDSIGDVREATDASLPSVTLSHQTVHLNSELHGADLVKLRQAASRGLERLIIITDNRTLLKRRFEIGSPQQGFAASRKETIDLLKRRHIVDLEDMHEPTRDARAVETSKEPSQQLPEREILER